MTDVVSFTPIWRAVLTVLLSRKVTVVSSHLESIKKRDDFTVSLSEGREMWWLIFCTVCGEKDILQEEQARQIPNDRWSPATIKVFRGIGTLITVSFI